MYVRTCIYLPMYARPHYAVQAVKWVELWISHIFFFNVLLGNGLALEIGY